MFKKIFRVISSAILITVLSNYAGATQFRVSDNPSFSPEQRIDDDLLTTGGKIRFEGTISGDLIAAGNSITQNGTVEGNFMAAAQHIDISGQVNKSSRTFSQYLNISSSVNRNLIAFGQKINLQSNGYVGRDVHVFCAELNLDGKIGQKLEGTADVVIVSGTIGGDVNIKANKITLLPTADIKGNLNYQSPVEADIQKGATILGKTEWKQSEEKKTALGKLLLKRFLNFLGLFIAGLILIPIFKDQIQPLKDNLKKSPFRSMGRGFIFLVSMLVLLLISILLSLIIIGIPLLVLSLVIILATFFLCKIAVGIALGDWVLTFLTKGENISPFLALLVGLFIYILLTSIPWFVGTLFHVLTLFAGTGAIIWVKRRSSETHRV